MVNLQDESTLSRLASEADELLEEHGSVERLAEVESALFTAGAEASLQQHVAAKMALAKAMLRAIETPFHVSVIFAMYREHNRILPLSEHPHGEDFLVRKVEQLQWLFDGAPGATWELIAVDDGCPEGSGRIARQVAESRTPEAPVRVLFLQEAIDRGDVEHLGIKTTADSQKGGSILFGMQQAVAGRTKDHVVIFTDADLSTHLGQVGLLVGPILGDGAGAAVGSRRLPRSMVIKQGHRNTRGKLFIYLWKRLISSLRFITDTQCGFKAFSADTVRAVIPGMRVTGFAFDIELLLLAQMHREGSIRRVPIAWIDSEAASTTSDLQPYLTMLKAVVSMYRFHLPSDDEAEPFASLIEGLNEEDWQSLVESVPPAIADADPATFGDSAPIAARALANVIGG